MDAETRLRLSKVIVEGDCLLARRNFLRRTKKRLDPKAIHASYGLDLRKDFLWSGDIMISAGGRFAELLGGDNGAYESATLKITAPLAWASSSKVKTGMIVDVVVKCVKYGHKVSSIGYMEKIKDMLVANIWIQEHFFNHCRSMLVSKKIKMLRIGGFELYRRNAKITDFEMLSEYDDEYL